MKTVSLTKVKYRDSIIGNGWKYRISKDKNTFTVIGINKDCSKVSYKHFDNYKDARNELIRLTGKPKGRKPTRDRKVTYRGDEI